MVGEVFAAGQGHHHPPAPKASEGRKVQAAGGGTAHRAARWKGAPLSRPGGARGVRCRGLRVVARSRARPSAPGELAHGGGLPLEWGRPRRADPFWAHACMGGSYCDFKLKFAAEPLPCWPPVFTQANDYR